ncbi:MAG: hypothetical protein KDD22_03890, partial [Bdellovibrionales bacterium]|nr:hypothetical protein [Bdellovibrionales bacterium]
MKILRALILVFLSMSMTMMMSCSSRPKKQPPVQAPTSVRQDFEKARLEIAASDPRKGLARLQKIAQSHPNSDLANES